MADMFITEAKNKKKGFFRRASEKIESLKEDASRIRERNISRKTALLEKKAALESQRFKLEEQRARIRNLQSRRRSMSPVVQGAKKVGSFVGRVGRNASDVFASDEYTIGGGDSRRSSKRRKRRSSRNMQRNNNERRPSLLDNLEMFG